MLSTLERPDQFKGEETVTHVENPKEKILDDYIKKHHPDYKKRKKDNGKNEED